MLRKLVFVFIALAAAGGVVLSLLTIPLLRRLPQQSRVSMDGITTLDDAVQACQRNNLHGWELVAYAQHLVARKFTYSRLNTWDTPARAFERGGPLLAGEVERAATWARMLFTKAEASHLLKGALS